MSPVPRRLLVFVFAAVIAGALRAVPAAAAGKPGYPNTIVWSGHTWQVKSSQSKVGPGPNYFSASTDNVSVGADGRLHLRITYRNGRWSCAEIISAESFGYGTYSFDVGSAVAALDPGVVLGLFTWSDKAAYNHREIDVEFARWGNATDPTNAQYVVQPYSAAGHLVRWTLPSGAASSTHDFTWHAGRVDFASVFDPAGGSNLWTYAGSDVPKPGGENVRLNLWLHGGAAPTDGQGVEVVINGFGFAP
jgi:hypothetical protein